MVQEGMVLEDYALEWTDRCPRLLPYLGRLCGEDGAEDEAVMQDGDLRIVIPHSRVFCFDARGRSLPAVSLHPYVGSA